MGVKERFYTAKNKRKKRGIIGILIALSPVTAVPLILALVLGAMLLLVIIATVIFITFTVNQVELPCDCELYIAEEQGGTIDNSLTGNENQIGTTGNIGTATSTLDGSVLSNGKVITLPSGLGDTFTYECWNRGKNPNWAAGNTCPQKCGWNPTSNQHKYVHKYCWDIGDKAFNSDGMGMIGDRYVIAMTPKFGNIGDVVDVYQSNGNIIKAIIGDAKGADAKNEWGHNNGHSVVEVMVDYDKWYKEGHENPGTKAFMPEWGGQTVVKVINYGNYESLKSQSDSLPTQTTQSSLAGGSQDLGYGNGVNPNATAPTIGTKVSEIQGTEYKAEFTAYTIYDAGCNEYDCKGNKVDLTKQTCAFPTSIADYGSYVYIKGMTDMPDYNGRLYVVTDVGGAIKVKEDGTIKIDLLFPDVDSAKQFGMRYGTIVVQKRDYNVTKKLGTVTSTTSTTNVTTTSQTQNNQKGLIGTLGEFSGLWKDLDTDIAKTNNGVSQDWQNLRKCVGHNPTPHTDYPEDNFKPLNGYGTVRYSQMITTSAGYTDANYNYINYCKTASSTTFSGSSCGICTTAEVMSTMTGRKVTPAEVAIAVNTYETRNGGNTIWSGSSGVVAVSNLEKLYKEVGFDVEYCTGGLINNKDKVDSTLDGNGMIVIVIANGTSPWAVSGSNHYIAIRNRVGDNYYAVDCGGSQASRYSAHKLSEYKDAGQGYILVKSAPTSLTGDETINNEQTLATGSVGYRIYKCKNCRCKGDYCNCHTKGAIHKEKGLKVYLGTNGEIIQTNGNDNKSTTDNVPKVNITPGTFDKTPGQFQGTWENGLTTEQLYNSAPVNGGRNVSDTVYKTALACSGTYGGNYKYATFGVPYFSQWSGIKEAWYGKLTLSSTNTSVSSGSNDLFSVGCAFYMGAHIMSAIQQKLINPAEMVVVYHHYNIVTPNGDFGGLSQSQAGYNSMLLPFGYKCKAYTKNQINDSVKNELDNALKSGVPCGIRVTSGDFNSGPSHFMCIDRMDGDNYIMAQSGKSATSTKAYSWNTVKKNLHTSGNGCLWIVSKN